MLKPRHQYLLIQVRAHWRRLAIALGCTVIVGVYPAAIAYMVQPVIDSVFIEKDVLRLKLIPLVIILIAITGGLGTYGYAYYMKYVGGNIIRQIRNLLFDKIQSFPLAFFHKEKIGALTSIITHDVNIIKMMVSDAVTGSVKDCFQIGMLIALIFYQDWQLALIAMVVMPIAFIPVIQFGRRVRKMSTRHQEVMSDISAYIQEAFLSTKIIKAFGMESYEKKRFHEKSQRLFRREMKVITAKVLSSPVMELLAGVGASLVIWYGGYQVIIGNSTPGKFFSFMTAVFMLYTPVKKLNRANNVIQQGLAAVDRVFDIIEQKFDIQDPLNPITLPPPPHRVTFQHVFFKYQADLVLEDVCLDVLPGEVIAIVGMSGGGKTTLVNLIPRFYEVSRGAVLIDGIDIRDLETDNLRRRIAIVTQEPILFNDSVCNNIGYGKPSASFEEIENAAKLAYAYDFIQSFPQKFDTNIGDLGNRLSGGEKQRICIARALLKDAPILILDEATSALDSEAEDLVQKALGNLMQGRTTFIIAHRLSTIRFAHRIVVLAKGRIMEAGNHDELMFLKREYYKLHQIQLNGKSGIVA